MTIAERHDRARVERHARISELCQDGSATELARAAIAYDRSLEGSLLNVRIAWLAFLEELAAELCGSRLGRRLASRR